MPEIHDISPDILLPLIGTPRCPVLIDIRLPEDVAADATRLPGALMWDHRDPAGLAARLGGRASVVICHKGLKLSQGVAAWLRSDGAAAHYLQGGAVAWRALPHAPRIAIAALPQAGPEGRCLWVTTTACTPELLAAAWLLRRFIEPEARLLFVAPDQIAAVAGRFGATALPPFAELLRMTGLDARPLPMLQDTLTQPGARAVLDGLRLGHATPEALLNAALPVLDALYLWSGAQTAGHAAGGRAHG